LFAVTAIGCGTAGSRLTPIINRFRSERIEVRDEALARLSALKVLTEAEALEALEAAGERFAPLTESYRDIGEELIRAAESRGGTEHIAVIRRRFGSYSSQARGAALQLLESLHTTEATETALDLIIAQMSSTASDPSLESIMYSILLEHFGEGEIPKRLAGRLTQAITAASQRYAGIVGPAQQSQGTAWMWEDDYLTPRSNAALLLDILGYIPSPEATAELRAALAYSDPYLKVFTIVSLLRHGIVAPPEQYEEVARSTTTRQTLHIMLKDIGRLDLFPKAFTSQAALAEGDMVNWLLYPTELGKPPDTIELMAVRSVESSEGTEDYYFFRFRANDSDVNQPGVWMAGVSGPYPHTGIAGTSAGGDTFSDFMPWTDQFPDNYMEELDKLPGERFGTNDDEGPSDVAS